MFLNGSRLTATVLLAFMLLVAAGCGNSGGPAIFNNTPTTLPLQIINQPPPAGQVGVPYSAIIQAFGGTQPYTFTQIGSSIPGLTLLPNGNLQGTPAAAQTFVYNVQVTDFSQPQKSATILFSISISSGGGPVTNSPPQWSPSPPTCPLVHQVSTLWTYDFDAFDADGDSLTYTIISITSLGGGGSNGNFTMDNAVMTSGQLSGGVGVMRYLPTISGLYTVRVQVADPTNPAVAFLFLVDVNPTGQGSAPVQPANITSSPIVAANEGQLYSYQPTASNNSGNPIAWGLSAQPPGGTMSINATTGLVTWTPDATHVPGPHTVTITADNGSALVASQQFQITVSASTLPASPVRVVVSNFTGSNRTQSWNRELSAVDPNQPSSPTLASGLSGKIFEAASPRLALTGPKHSLRIGGGGVPVEVGLNTTNCYIQCPTYSAVDPTAPTTSVLASCRLFHTTDAESSPGAVTGTNDIIFAVDTLGTTQVFSFNTNINEEIYVLPEFSTDPFFVVVSESGKRMWYCRVDRRNFIGSGSNMMEVSFSGGSALGANERIMHQSITRLDVNYWFVVRDIPNSAAPTIFTDRLFCAPVEAVAASTQPLAVVPGLPSAGLGLTVPTDISTYFYRSGDAQSFFVVAGNNITSGIATANPGVDLAGLWRDIWKVDAVGPTISRLTEYETNRPAAGPNVRLIEVFDSGSLYRDDEYYLASSGADVGGNDNRTIFGYHDNSSATTHVGHCPSYDGALVAFVLLETNIGCTDGTGTSVRKEVYVCNTLTGAPMDLIRVTASPAATDAAGIRVAAAPVTYRFQVNMGVCTGLFFAQRGASGGRDRRLYFTFGRADAGTTLEYGQALFAAEFATNGVGVMTHVSTTDRLTGVAAATGAAGGFDIATPTTNIFMMPASWEGAGSASGVLQLATVAGTAGAIPAGTMSQLCEIDLMISNAAYVPSGTGNVVPVFDAGQNLMDFFGVDNQRTLFGSGFQGISPWGPTPASNVPAPHISSLFAGVPGPATATIMNGTAFVACITATGVENLYQFNQAGAGIRSANMTQITTPGRIHRIDVAADGSAVAVHRGTNTFATPSDRIGTTILGNDIWVIPNVATAYQRNLLPAPNPLPATSLAIPATDYTARLGVWVNTNLISPNTYEYWYAHGSTTVNGQGRPESALTLRKVRCLPQATTPLVGAVQVVSSSTTPGAITIYGAGD